jgi:hypothetical protein
MVVRQPLAGDLQGEPLVRLRPSAPSTNHALHLSMGSIEAIYPITPHRSTPKICTYMAFKHVSSDGKF